MKLEFVASEEIEWFRDEEWNQYNRITQRYEESNTSLHKWKKRAIGEGMYQLCTPEESKQLEEQRAELLFKESKNDG